MGFETRITLAGPPRAPAQMLAEQEYGDRVGAFEGAGWARIAFILEDADAVLLITQESLSTLGPPRRSVDR